MDGRAIIHTSIYVHTPKLIPLLVHTTPAYLVSSLGALCRFFGLVQSGQPQSLRRAPITSTIRGRLDAARAAGGNEQRSKNEECIDRETRKLLGIILVRQSGPRDLGDSRGITSAEAASPRDGLHWDRTCAVCFGRLHQPLAQRVPARVAATRCTSGIALPSCAHNHWVHSRQK